MEPTSGFSDGVRPFAPSVARTIGSVDFAGTAVAVGFNGSFQPSEIGSVERCVGAVGLAPSVVWPFDVGSGLGWATPFPPCPPDPLPPLWDVKGR